ncbi:MAG: tetratricopeptide repeat protein [Clostridia bacterium]|nr:tetratricopeptide repeat protein [Clostridia bacterium]
MFERINGKYDADTTAPMRLLARIYSKTNRHEQAVVMQKSVVDIIGKNMGKKSVPVL